MTRYETLMLLAPDIDQTKVAKLENFVSTLSSKARGKMLSFDVWGKYKLSYPVKKHDYGVYVLARFEMGEDITGALEELKSFFKIKCNDIVMRFINRQLSQNTSLEYQKPEAIVAGEHCVSFAPEAQEGTDADEQEAEGAPDEVAERVDEGPAEDNAETEETPGEASGQEEGNE